jgi:REP-associated tyrosine transposase
MPYFRLFYHIVWSIRKRDPLITNLLQEPIHKVIANKVVELHGIVHALNSMPDHVHLVATIPPSLALADLVGQIKGSSSHFANHVEGSPRNFAWQAEYGVTTISESHLPVVVRYVVQQQQHHAANSLNMKLENWE